MNTTRSERYAEQRKVIKCAAERQFAYVPRGKSNIDNVEVRRALSVRFLDLAFFAIENVDPGRELSLMLTNLENSFMYAHAALDRAELDAEESQGVN